MLLSKFLLFYEKQSSEITYYLNVNLSILKFERKAIILKAYLPNFIPNLYSSQTLN